MLARQYLSIDEEMDVKNINDEEIVSLVNLPFSNKEDEIEELAVFYPTISVKSALDSLQVLSDFLSNPSAEFAYDRGILFKLRSLRNNLLAYSISKKKQPSIDSFIRN